MQLTLSRKHWVGIGLALATQFSQTAQSQTIAFASMPARQLTTVRQEMKLKNALLDLQRHYGVEIVFEDRLVGQLNIVTGSVGSD